MRSLGTTLTATLMLALANSLLLSPAQAQNSQTQFRLNIPGQAAPANAPRSYMVFFSYDSETITSVAQDLLNRIAAENGQNSGSLITLTGHTDTAGSRFYNLGLSQRRALAVRDVLAQRGVPRDRIQVYWRGEFDLLVPTWDNVDEFRNRRVEIDVQ